MAEAGTPRALRATSTISRPTGRDWVNSVCTLVIGCCIGWFLGLALQSIGGTVLTQILTFLTGTAGILAGVGVATEGSDGATRANPIAIMILLVGLVGGSILSSYARANLWPRPNAQKIEELTGIPAKKVNERVFDSLYAPTATLTKESVVPNAMAAAAQIDCATLKTLNPAQQLEAMKKMNVTDPTIQKIIATNDPNKISFAVQRLCGP